MNLGLITYKLVTDWDTYYPDVTRYETLTSLGFDKSQRPGYYYVHNCEFSQSYRAITMWGLPPTVKLLTENIFIHDVHTPYKDGGGAILFTNDGSIVQSKMCFQSVSGAYYGQTSYTAVGFNGYQKNYILDSTYTGCGKVIRDYTGTFYAKRGEIKIDSCNISKNTNIGSCGYAVADVCIQSSIKYCNVAENNAPNGIGVIVYSAGSYNVKYCNHYKCFATDRCILVENNAGSVTWNNCVIRECGCQYNGVFWLIGYLTLQNCCYENNRGQKVGGLGWMYGAANFAECYPRYFNLNLYFYQLYNCVQEKVANPPDPTPLPPQTPAQSPAPSPEPTPARSPAPSPPPTQTALPDHPPQTAPPPQSPNPTPKPSPSRSPLPSANPTPNRTPDEEYNPIVYTESNQIAPDGPVIDISTIIKQQSDNADGAKNGGAVIGKESSPDTSPAGLIIAGVAGVAAVGLIAGIVYMATRKADIPDMMFEQPENIPNDSPVVENDNPIYGNDVDDPFANEFDIPDGPGEAM